jgi:hypothetical protein
MRRCKCCHSISIFIRNSLDEPVTLCWAKVLVVRKNLVSDGVTQIGWGSAIVAFGEKL